MTAPARPLRPDRPTLYGAPGWGSTLTEAMLAMAGIPHDFVDVSGFDEPGANRDLVLALNPLGQVPVLVLTDGTIMTESAAIALHLADIAPDAGLAPPPGTPERARFLRYLVWIVANIYPTFTYGDYPARWSEKDVEGLLETTNAYRRRLWQWFDGEVESPYALGETMSALDIYLAIMVHWRPGRPWFAEHAPRIAAIAEHSAQHPVLGEILARNFADLE